LLSDKAARGQEWTALPSPGEGIERRRDLLRRHGVDPQEEIGAVIFSADTVSTRKTAPHSQTPTFPANIANARSRGPETWRRSWLAVAVLVLAGVGGFDVCIDRARDGQVDALVLQACAADSIPARVQVRPCCAGQSMASRLIMFVRL
jgi:hypothetical protein